MKITLRNSYNGREQHHATTQATVLIGRRKPGAVEVDFDLSEDVKVSRPWHDHKGYWIEDLDSRHGTLVNGREIREIGPHPLAVGDEIVIGIDCGVLLNGFIGNAERMEFAVVGDAANFASRYCSGALGGQVLISESMRKHVWNLVDAEPIRLTTKHEGEVNAYVVKGLHADVAAWPGGSDSA